MTITSLSRRQALSLIGTGSAALVLQGCGAGRLAAAPAPRDAAALLDTLAWDLLRLSPEAATSLGIDTGAHAALRSQLADRSPAGQNAIAALEVVSHGYLLENGRIVMHDSADAMKKNPDIQEFYLGGSEGKNFHDIKHYSRRKRWLS